MAWQNEFNAIVGPGLFAGITAGDWLGLLRANRFAIHPSCAARCLSISAASPVNSILRRLETGRYDSRVAAQQIAPPLFVLGHWRSGTTHLHNVLSRDDRFAYPTLYQVLYPHSFLTTGTVGVTLLSAFLPRTRLGIDNVKMAWNMPYEDEFAIAAMTGLSPYVTMAFPLAQGNYDRFLTLADASPAEIDRWKGALIAFLQKLTWTYRRPLILKSPGHTCRIKLLLELFPEAKFVHIRRNPIHVFQSMRRMATASLKYWTLQKADAVDWEERMVRQYREMYDAYFLERELIPEGRLYEMSYEDLETNPLEQVRQVYETLALPEFSYVESTLRKYFASLTNYRKNNHAEPSADVYDRLGREWRTCFDHWGYPTTPAAAGQY